MNDKLEIIWKIMGCGLTEVLSWYLPASTDENHENPQSG
jgi:hypothetical protein